MDSEERIPEQPGVGRLGRRVRHDPRSLAYRYPARSTGALRSVRHHRYAPVLDQLDVEHRLVWMTNSWSQSWGVAGRACLGWDDFGRLFDERGDVTVFTPVSEPPRPRCRIRTPSCSDASDRSPRSSRRRSVSRGGDYLDIMRKFFFC